MYIRVCIYTVAFILNVFQRNALQIFEILLLFNTEIAVVDYACSLSVFSIFGPGIHQYDDADKNVSKQTRTYNTDITKS